MDFIPSTEVIAAFTLAGLLLNVTPGPDMTLQVSRALNQGKSAAYFVMVGTMSGVLVHVFLAAAGISALIAASPSAFLVVKYLGALYLGYLAVMIIKDGSAFNVERRSPTLYSRWHNMRAGFFINLLNPKVVLFFITFFPQFVSIDDPHATKKLMLLGLYFIVVSTPVAVVYIAMADRLANALQENRKIMRGIDYLFAGVFGAFAVKIIFTRVAGNSG